MNSTMHSAMDSTRDSGRDSIRNSAADAPAQDFNAQPEPLWNKIDEEAYANALSDPDDIPPLTKRQIRNCVPLRIMPGETKMERLRYAKALCQAREVAEAQAGETFGSAPQSGSHDGRGEMPVLAPACSRSTQTDQLHWFSMPGPDGVCWHIATPAAGGCRSAAQRLRTAGLSRAAGLSPPAKGQKLERPERKGRTGKHSHCLHVRVLRCWGWPLPGSLRLRSLEGLPDQGQGPFEFAVVGDADPPFAAGLMSFAGKAFGQTVRIIQFAALQVEDEPQLQALRGDGDEGVPVHGKGHVRSAGPDRDGTGCTPWKETLPEPQDEEPDAG